MEVRAKNLNSATSAEFVIFGWCANAHPAEIWTCAHAQPCAYAQAGTRLLVGALARPVRIHKPIKDFELCVRTGWEWPTSGGAVTPCACAHP